MRILQIVPVFSDPFGGPVTVVRSISKELAKKHEVTIYTTTASDLKNDFEPREEEVNGYRVYYFARNFKQLIYSDLFGQMNISLNMRKAVKDHLKEFDIVHIHSWQQFPDMLLHHYTKKYNIPFVLQVHGSLPQIGPKTLLKWVYDISFGYKILRDASKVIALSEVEAQQYGSMGVPDEKIAVIPNGIDLSEYAVLPSSGSFKRKFDIPDRKKIVLYLGRIHKTKGVDLLAKAYAYLIKEMKCNDALLVIAGPDDGYLSEVRSLVASLGISNSVLFTGFISSEDKLSALVDADVFVTPSFYGFPVTFLEACATGTPIITTNLGDTLEWIYGNVGYVTLPSHYELAKAIYAIISDDELRRKFSRNCINIVRSKFSLEKVVTQLEKIYEEVKAS